MQTKSRVLTSFFLLILLVIIFIVGWLWGKVNTGLFKNLPLTGNWSNQISISASPEANTDNLPPFGKYEAKDMTTVTPWDNNIDRTTGYYEPTKEELNSVYNDYLKSIETRDYDLYSRTVSKRTKWLTDANSSYFNTNYDGLVINRKGLIQGEEYFKTGFPESIEYQRAKDIKFFQPQILQEATIPAEQPSYLEDALTQKTELINDIAITKSKTVYYTTDFKYTIRNNENFNSFFHGLDGYIVFVYENGKWVFHLENWNTAFKKDLTVSYEYLDEKQDIKRNVLNLLDSKSLLDITIKSGEIIKWENMKGKVFSNEADKKGYYFNSPTMAGNSFEIQFNKPGQIKYTFLNNEKQYSYGTIIID